LYNPVDFLYHDFHPYPEVRENKEISLPGLVKMYRSEKINVKIKENVHWL